MKHYGLVGRDIDYSLSPCIHNLYYDMFDIEATYDIFDVQGDLADTLATLKEKNIHGFNVTTPFKTEILPFLDELSHPAQRMQSVNTVINKGGRWIGDNTDSLGFKKAMVLNQIEVKNKTALIVGAGGAARAVIHALIDMGIKTVLIYSRTRKKTNALMIEIKQSYEFDNVMSVYDTHGTVIDIIVNTTPLGGLHYPDDLSIDLNYVVAKHFIDLNYTPAETATMKLAKSLGIQALGGFDMLVAQGVYANMLWHEMHVDNAAFTDFIERTRYACGQ